jgi:predicted  nucleic acid-binding Zn-ribbon protein
MDKKAKKRIDLLHKKIGDLQQRLAGAKQQLDDPDEVRQLEVQIAAAHQEIEKLKATWS